MFSMLRPFTYATDHSRSSAAPDPVHSPVRAAPAAPQTRGSHGITQPKQYTDGTVRWCLSSSTEEPINLKDALANKDWKRAMDEEHKALMQNKTWHLVPASHGKNVIDC